MLEFTEETTIQECVDYSVKQIVKQGGQCLNVSGDCAYGDGKGNHCGVGWLLDPDDRAMMEYSGSSNGLLTSLRAEFLPKVLTDNPKILDKLQDFHDATTLSFKDHAKEALEDLGIDCSGDHFKKWYTI